MKVSTHPLAADELVDGASFYAREASIALAQDFISEFERSVDLLRANPKLGPVFHGGFRRLPLRRFPYSLVYFVAGEEIRIIAVAHQRRRPGCWRSRT